jgi:hypothetical protein
MGSLLAVVFSGFIVILEKAVLVDSFINLDFLFSILSNQCQCLSMNKRLLTFFSVFMIICLTTSTKITAQTLVDAQLKPQLEAVYMQWRTAMIKKNYNLWSQYTASHRQVHIKNRIVSEKKSFPAWVFEVPASPPALDGLKALSVSAKGATATAVYFGKVDFGVGGNPTENILLLNFINERGRWKYDKAEFIRLTDLEEVRKKIKAGDLSYIKQEDFQPSGVLPQPPIAVNAAKYIAKVYVFCPGREVKVKVNKISDHRFQNTKMSEVVTGGGLDGLNEVQFATKSLEGSTGKEAVCIRVYLMSTVKDVKPIKMFEYLVNEDGKVKQYGSANFVIDQAVVNKLNGK